MSHGPRFGTTDVRCHICNRSGVNIGFESQIMQLLTKGNKQRTQEPTAANKTSSRSHAILQVTVKQKNKVKNVMEEVRVGKLFMVDLAGTERASQVRSDANSLMSSQISVSSILNHMLFHYLLYLVCEEAFFTMIYYSPSQKFCRTSRQK